MSERVCRAVTIAAVCVILGGCGIGYNSVLFVTKSNVGLDIDSKPPTAQVSIERLEGVFAPTFEGGQTPPVMASFRSEEKGLLGIFFSVASTFAGGDAAATLARSDGQSASAAVCLTEAPKLWTSLGVSLEFPKPGDVRPFIFGTDTSFGLKVAWSGLTAEVPDTVRLGYQRKELSWAPVSLTPIAAGQFPTVCRAYPAARYVVNIPSFLATIDAGATVGTPSKSGYRWLQNFATGEAATTLAARDDIAQVMLSRLEPAVAVSEYGPDANTPCIQKWLRADLANRRRLIEWMRQNEIAARPSDLADGSRYAAERAKAVKDPALNIPCP